MPSWFFYRLFDTSVKSDLADIYIKHILHWLQSLKWWRKRKILTLIVLCANIVDCSCKLTLVTVTRESKRKWLFQNRDGLVGWVNRYTAELCFVMVSFIFKFCFYIHFLVAVIEGEFGLCCTNQPHWFRLTVLQKRSD